MNLRKLVTYAMDEVNLDDTGYMEDPPAPKTKAKGKTKGKSKKNPGASAQDESLFSCALDSIDVADDNGPKFDGKVKTFTFKVKIDASKYAKRFGIDIPDDSADAVLSPGENGKNEGEAKAGEVGDKVVTDSATMDANVSFGEGVKATIEECRARNPMTCRFHGSQALANHIQGILTNKGLTGDVNVNFRGVLQQGGKNWIQADIEVAVPNTEENVNKLNEAMAEFAGNDGAVTGIDFIPGTAGEGRNGGVMASVDFDMDKLDENARGRWHLVEPEVQAQVAQATGVPQEEVAEAVENSQAQVAQAEAEVGTVSPELTRAREELTFAQQMLENAPAGMRDGIQQMVDAAQARVDALMPQDSPELLQAREELAFAQQMLENAPAGMRAAVQNMVDAAQARVNELTRPTPAAEVAPAQAEAVTEPEEEIEEETPEEEDDPNYWENLDPNTREYWAARRAADNGDIGDIEDDQLEHARNVLGENDPLFLDILDLYNLHHNTNVTPDGVSAHAGETDPMPGDGRTAEFDRVFNSGNWEPAGATESSAQENVSSQTAQAEEEPTPAPTPITVNPEEVAAAEAAETQAETIRVDAPYNPEQDGNESAQIELSQDEKTALIDEYNRAKTQMNGLLQSLRDRGIVTPALNRDGSPKLDENGNQIMEPDVNNREDADAMKYRRWSSYRAAIGDVIGKYSNRADTRRGREGERRITEAGHKLGNYANKGELMARVQEVLSSNRATMMNNPNKATAFKRSVNMAKFLGSKLGANVSVDPTNGNMKVDWTDNPTPVNTNFDYIRGDRNGQTPIQANSTSTTTQAPVGQTTTATPQDAVRANGGNVSADGNTVTAGDTSGSASTSPTMDGIRRVAQGATNLVDNQADGGGLSFTLPGNTSQAEIDRIVADLQRQYGEGYEVTATRDGRVSMRPSVNTSTASSLFNGIRANGGHLPTGSTITGSNGNFSIGGIDGASARGWASTLSRMMPTSSITPVQNADGTWTIRITPRSQNAGNATATEAPAPTVTLTAPTLQTQEARDLGTVLGGAVREQLNRVAQEAPAPHQTARTNGTAPQAPARPRTPATDSDISRHINDALSRLVDHWGGGSDRILRGINDAIAGNRNADVDRYLGEAESVLGRDNPVMQAIRNRTANPTPAAAPAQPAPAAQATARPAAGTLTAERARAVNANLSRVIGNIRSDRARQILSRIQANAQRVAGQ